MPKIGNTICCTNPRTRFSCLWVFVERVLSSESTNMFSQYIKLVNRNFSCSWFDPFQLLKHTPEPSMTHESSAALETAPPWQQHFRDPPLSSCALPAPSSSSYTTVVYLWIIFFRLISFICLIALIKVLYLAYAGLFYLKEEQLF